MMPDCREKLPNMAMTFEAETQECWRGLFSLALAIFPRGLFPS
jgi:hypothetical protein